MCSNNEGVDKDEGRINRAGSKEMTDGDKQLSRREFIQQTAVVDAGIMLTGPSPVFEKRMKRRD
jgi:hypothetical protein